MGFLGNLVIGIALLKNSVWLTIYMLLHYTQMKNSGTYTYNASDSTYDKTKNFYAVQFTPSGEFFEEGKVTGRYTGKLTAY